MEPSSNQIKIYKKLRELAEPHHKYSDQIMAIAIWIDKEHSDKTSVIDNAAPVISDCPHPMSHRREKYGKPFCYRCQTVI